MQFGIHFTAGDRNEAFLKLGGASIPEAAMTFARAVVGALPDAAKGFDVAIAGEWPQGPQSPRKATFTITVKAR